MVRYYAYCVCFVIHTQESNSIFLHTGRFKQRDIFVLKLRQVSGVSFVTLDPSESQRLEFVLLQAKIDNRSLEKQLILKNDHVAQLVDNFE